jgi:glycosyltransferase involved in cell wall biosynthesis
MAGAGARFIVQTPVMKDAFLGAYSLPPDRVFAILQAVPRTVMNLASREIRPDAEIIRASDGQLKLLFMAGYYPHKNHSVIIPVLRELRKRGMDRRVHFFLTLSPEGDHRSREFMEALTPYQDQVTNLGVLSPDRIPGVYAAADALFLPTFLESLGLPYLEALATGTPILTSDRDFARWICEDLALYFEPKDPASIATAIGRLIENPEVSGYPARAGERLKAFPRDWKVVAQEYVGLLLKTVAAQPSKSGS